MSRILIGCACLVLSVAAAPALAGGHPVLAVEMPAKALDRQTKEAALVVRASQCGAPIDAAVVGRAEGVVAGKRQTIPLRLRVTSQEGAWAVSKQWPDEGRWMLVFTVESHGRATAIVELPASRGAATAPKIELVNRKVELSEIETRLKG